VSLLQNLRAPEDQRPFVVVLVISNLEYGGAQRQVVELVNNTDPARCDLHVCSLSDYVPLAAHLRERQHRLHVVQKYFKYDISVVPRLARLLRELRAHVVQGYLFDAQIASRLAAWLAGTPVVVDSERNTDYYLKRRQLLAYRLTRGLVDGVIANSRAGVAFNRRMLGHDPAQYRVIHNGVDHERFCPTDASAARAALGIADDEGVVGMFGSFKAQKNHPLLLAAAVRVLARVPRTRFVFVGDELYAGMRDSTEYQRFIRALVDELGIRERCLFLGNRADVESLYCACDLTVLPSLFEGTPNVVLESMACGVPVVCTDVSDNAMIVPDGRVGYIVPLGDESALADRILELLQNESLRRRMGRAAREWVMREFSTATLARKTVDVYEDLLSSSPRRASNQTRPGDAVTSATQPTRVDSLAPFAVPLVTLRALPYPYRAVLAICSDLDETPDRRVYLEIMRFLNTTEATSMGRGLGLEVGNTIYFDMPPGQFSYWNTDDAGRQMIHALIESGHIDCLHSYGDLATTRSHAGRALDALTHLRRRLEVWIDHSVAPSNFGPDIMKGHGDEPGSPVYHADLTHAYGIGYVWRGRVTSVIGQDAPRSLRGIFEPRHPWASTRTAAKELAKGALGRRGNGKYGMHCDNRLLRLVSLRDGQRVFEFLRCNPYWGGVQHAATADGLAEALAPRVLEHLVRREGVCVLYTHLGKVRDRRQPLGPRTRAALRRLAAYHHAGKLLVTTTRRLLGLRRAVAEVQLSVSSEAGWSCIALDLPAISRGEKPPLVGSDLDGLTLYVPDPDRTRVLLNGREVTRICHNPPDHTGRPSVSLRWPQLEFPRL